MNYPYLFTYISSLFPKLDTELKYETPFQLLVAVILSAQTTDKQVNKITDQLFKTITTPYDIIALGSEKLEKAISSVNYYKAKARHLFQTATLLCETGKLASKQKRYTIPVDEKELMKLPWVWEKTAKVIQYVLYKKPVIAVDTHVHRVVNRLGIVHTKTPAETSKQLPSKIPEKFKLIAHHAFILFGRYHCKAIKPHCEQCELKKFCTYFLSSHSN